MGSLRERIKKSNKLVIKAQQVCRIISEKNRKKSIF